MFRGRGVAKERTAWSQRFRARAILFELFARNAARRARDSAFISLLEGECALDGRDHPGRIQVDEKSPCGRSRRETAFWDIGPLRLINGNMDMKTMKSGGTTARGHQSLTNHDGSHAEDARWHSHDVGSNGHEKSGAAAEKK
jgi:hypothetical protein